MSKIVATVQKIQNIDNLHIVSFLCDDVKLKMMSLDISANIKEGKKVLLNTKPSSISLARDLQGQISISNKLDVKIISILKGELLSIITLDFKGFKLESLLTTVSVEQMDLKEGEELNALIKASELYIAECLDE